MGVNGKRVGGALEGGDRVEEEEEEDVSGGGKMWEGFWSLRHLTLSFPLPSARKCSRWQFECHSSGECIAIYNACDGIPQCQDGSDEDPKLFCPTGSSIP